MTNTTSKKTKPSLALNHPIHLGLFKLATYFGEWTKDLDQYFVLVADIAMPMKKRIKMPLDDVKRIIVITARGLLIIKSLQELLDDFKSVSKSYQTKYFLEKAKELDNTIAITGAKLATLQGMFGYFKDLALEHSMTKNEKGKNMKMEQKMKPEQKMKTKLEQKMNLTKLKRKPSRYENRRVEVKEVRTLNVS